MGVDMSDPNAADDIATTELHLPVGKKVVLKIRSQDVTHSVYLPHFRAQMNAVPGMVTQFAFTPTITTADMRQRPAIMDQVAGINEIRSKESAKRIAAGEEGLDPYTFNYVLLCNKICGASHYNMQMKVVVESEADFKTWLKDQKTIKSAIAATTDAAPAPVAEVTEVVAPEVVIDSTAIVAQVIK
jgi:cytochrome c oxidase subunit II